MEGQIRFTDDFRASDGDVVRSSQIAFISSMKFPTVGKLEATRLESNMTLVE